MDIFLFVLLTSFINNPLCEIEMKLLKFVIITIVLGCLADLGYCDRIKNNIYDNVDGAFCFRRLNGTHQTGCSCKKLKI